MVMRFYKHGLVFLRCLFNLFHIWPLGNAAADTFLSPDWRNTEICKDMGLVYPSIPNTLASIIEPRTKLIDPETVVWFQAGSDQWFKLAHVITVHRNSSFGTSFEARREPRGKKGNGPEFSTCMKTPAILRAGGGVSKQCC